MNEAQTSQFVLRLSAAEDAPDATEVVEAIAIDLPTELADAGVSRVERLPSSGAPEGTRGLGEIVAVCSFIITAVQTGESVGRAVAAIRRVVDRYTRRGKRVRVTIAGVDVDLATADDDATARIVRALLALPTRPLSGVRDALVIANAHYDDPGLARLRSPAHDADALARVLGDPAIGGFDVELMTDADERSIRRRVAAFFADRDRDDLLLLHFSCHGVKDIRGRLHLAARDTDLSVLGATSVPASFVHEVLDETQSRRVVLILDCCYSGAFTRGASVRSGSEVHVAEAFGVGTGRVVLTASSATEYAFEGGDLTQAQAQPSVFTAALVDGLETGAADLDADGEISIDELYDYIYRLVRDRTPGQAPMKWSFGVEGNLVLARSVRPAALPPSIMDDLASDRVVLRLEAIRAMAQLLAAGKPGQRATALSALAQVSDTDDSVQVRRAARAALGEDDPNDAPAANDAAATAVLPPQAPTAQAQPAPAPATEPDEDARPVPAVAAAPPVTAPTTTGRPNGLLVAAGLLVAVSVLLYAVALYGVADVIFADDWYHNLIWVVQLAGAGLLLATRRALWTWFLLGALAWSWVDLGPTLHSSAQNHFQDAWGFLVTADLIAVAAQTCLVVAAIRDRDTRPRLERFRVAASVPLAALAVATSLLAVPLLYHAWQLDLAEGGGLRAVSGIVCAAAIPAAILARRDDRAAAFLPVGWLFGGAELAITVSINLSHDGASDSTWTRVTALWILVPITAAATIATRLLLNRSAGANSRKPAEKQETSGRRAIG